MESTAQAALRKHKREWFAALNVLYCAPGQSAAPYNVMRTAV